MQLLEFISSAPDPAEVVLHLQRRSWQLRNYDAAAFFKRHLAAIGGPAPTNVEPDFAAEIEEHERKMYRGSRTSPHIQTSDRGEAARQERIYRKHNVTRTVQVRKGMIAKPNDIDQQCQCSDCCAHRRRAEKTAVARPGREC